MAVFKVPQTYAKTIEDCITKHLLGCHIIRDITFALFYLNFPIFIQVILSVFKKLNLPSNDYAILQHTFIRNDLA